MSETSIKEEFERLQVKLAKFQYLINALGYLNAAKKGAVLEHDIHVLLEKEIREIVPVSDTPLVPELIRPQQ